MNIVEILQRHAVERANDAAIVDRRGPLTFRELDEASARVAARLEQRGLGAGDPALILCPMSSDLYVTLKVVLPEGGDKALEDFVRSWAPGHSDDPRRHMR